MNLVVDIGNTCAKAALFEDGRLVRLVESGELRVESYDRAIVVSTKGELPRIPNALVMTHNTPVPIKNLYATPRTLGLDRLAAAVGASVLFPGEGVLICDFGTAITFDLMTADGEFLGGNISPGAAMRFRALNEQTAALPLESLPEDSTLDAAAGEKKCSKNTERCPALMDGGLSARFEGGAGEDGGLSPRRSSSATSSCEGREEPPRLLRSHPSTGGEQDCFASLAMTERAAFFAGGEEPPRLLRSHPSTGGEPDCFASLAMTERAAFFAGGEGPPRLLRSHPSTGGEFPEDNTREAIRSGVLRGIVAETISYIEAARERLGEDVKIIFTGGDADYFAERVNFPIFACSELVLWGLNAILEHNAK